MRIFLFLFFISLSAQAKEYHWKVLDVVDGDTINIENIIAIEELPLKVRVFGIDTPESGWRAKCRKELMLAKKAKEFAKSYLMNSKDIYFTDIKWDKYGGRIVAKVFVDGQDLSKLLIDNNLARPYFGDKKQGWCD